MNHRDTHRYLLTLPADRDNADGWADRSHPTSPVTAALNNLSMSPKPRTRRASSFKRPKTTNHSISPDMDEIRPRTSSMPTRNTLRRPNVLHLANLGAPIEQDVETYTLRSFKLSSKGIVVNRGDSLMSRSTTSILSSNSDICPLSVSSDSRESLGRTSPMGARLNVVPYRILVLGDVGVGKTAISQQFMTSEYLGGFDTSIDTMEERTVSVLLNGEESDLYFMHATGPDGAGDTVGIDGYLVVYACDDRETFHHAVDILYMLRKQQQRDTAVIFVGNKSDLVRSKCVTTEGFKEVKDVHVRSANTGRNVKLYTWDSDGQHHLCAVSARKPHGLRTISEAAETARGEVGGGDVRLQVYRDVRRAQRPRGRAARRHREPDPSAGASHECPQWMRLQE